MVSPSSLVITLLRTAPFVTKTAVAALIPQSPDQQTRRAIASVRDAIASAKTTSKPLRFYLDYLIPLPPETRAEDIDPWPGGLAQMYPYAEDVVSEILRGVVEDPVLRTDRPNGGGGVGTVLSAPDCCGLFVQESNLAASEDVAAVLFPGPDQLDVLEDVDKMVGESRTLLIVNRQFTREADFGLTPKRRERARKTVFDRFSWGFAFQEFACRGEDTKLTFEYDRGWQSCVVCEEEEETNGEGGRTVATIAREIGLLEDRRERPAYKELEEKIDEVLPEPLWMRKMQEAKVKGFKFQRGE